MKNTAIVVLCLISFQGYTQKISKLKQKALAEVEGLSEQIHSACQQLWDYSEIALKEKESANYLSSLLEDADFSIESGVGGMPTAFVATFGTGKPVIGILAEYDALPGVGNAPVPAREGRTDGVSSGHGCGHNLFGSASVNAAIALKNLMTEGHFSGTIKLFGTPAEETLTGKVYMANEGVFNGLDAVLDWHPTQSNEVTYTSSLAMNNFEVEFFGQAAHGAYDPWNGRSALDAVEAMNYMVNMMREHIYPSTRIHYVVPNAGDAPNVVPEYAKVWYYVRDTSRSNVEKFYDRILKIAEGAALGTNTTHKVTLITGVHEYNLNEPMLRNIQSNLQLVGPPTFTAEEQEWARKLQQAAEKDQDGFDTKITSIPSDWEKLQPGGGSTDVAEVSFQAPTAGFGVATAPKNVPWHSWATSASHGTEAAYRATEVATKVLTLSGVDLFTDAKYLAEAQAYFKKKVAGKPYVSPIPKDQKVVLPKG
ncbi:MAG: amidohydrolase [Cyclobacteriaceae bacterium]